MPVRPVSPSVADTPVNIDHHVEQINARLSLPWANYERSSGRRFDVGGIDTPEREALESTFRAAGWDVRFTSDQRDGSALVFKPRPPYRPEPLVPR